MKRGTLKLASLILIIVLQNANIKAQQLPITNQIFTNNYSLSPAYAGNDGAFVGFLNVRNAVLGFDGINRLTSINVNGMATKNGGLGLYINSFDEGFLNQSQIGMSYAHYISFGKESKSNLSIGIDASYFGNGIKQDLLNAEDANDALLTSGSISSSGYGISLGASYQCGKWDVGVALPNLFATELNYIGTALNYNLENQYQMNVSYLLDDKIANMVLQPRVNFRAISPSIYQVDLGMVSTLKERFLLGAYYRTESRVGFLAGIKMENAIDVMYSYEHATSNEVIRGVHEISLKVNISKLSGKSQSDDESNEKLVKMIDSLDKELLVLKSKIKDQKSDLNKSILDGDNKRLSELEKEVQNVSDRVTSNTQRIDSIEWSLKELEKVIKMKNESSLEEGYYVVIESSIDKEKTFKAAKEWMDKGFKDVAIIQSKTKTWYYIYASRFDRKADAINFKRGFVQEYSLPKTWIYPVLPN